MSDINHLVRGKTISYYDNTCNQVTLHFESGDSLLIISDGNLTSMYIPPKKYDFKLAIRGICDKVKGIFA